MQVCLNSAGVQLELGILERRRFHWQEDWQQALHQFRLAQAIEPCYSDPI